MFDRYSLTRCRHGLMACEEGDMISTLLRIYGEWAENSFRLLKPLIPVNGTVIDIGANVGTLTLAFANHVTSGGRVLAFEAQQRVFYNLCTNLMLNNLHWVEARQCLVGSADGSTQLPLRQLDNADRRSINRGGIGFVSVLESPSQFRGENQIDIHALDTCAEPLSRCDLIKVDVEGAEPMVLDGAMGTIQRFRPYLYLECGNEELLQAIQCRLAPLDYQLYWHASPHYNPDNYRGLNNVTGDQGDLNLLAVPQEKDDALNCTLPAVQSWQQIHELYPSFRF